MNQWLEDIKKNFNVDGGLSIPLKTQNEEQVETQESPRFAMNMIEKMNCGSIPDEDVKLGLEQLSNVIGQGNIMLAKYLEHMLANKVINRNKKPKRIGEELRCSQNDFPVIEYKYDDGTMRTLILTKSVTGHGEIFSMDFQGYAEIEKFGVLFREEGIFCVGSKKRLKGDYLYECFLKTGIRFNPEIPKPIIARVLHNYFVPLIENSSDKFIISPFAGWDNGKFTDANNFIWQKTSEFPDLPVFHKEFEWMKEFNRGFDVFFEYLNQINSLRDRVLVMTFPFASCIASIINREWRNIPFFLNFVLMKDFEWVDICGIIQIFNRDDLHPDSLDITAKELDEILQNANDECLIFDATSIDEDGYYLENKLRNYAVKVGNLVTGKIGKKKRRKAGGCATAAIFSSSAYQQKNCLNVYIDDDFWKDNGLKNEFDAMQAMGSVLTAFVVFVENHYDEVCGLIRKRRSETDDRKVFLDIMEEILQMFWEKQGIQMHQVLKLPIDFKFSSIIYEEIDEDDLLRIFIKGVRNSMTEFCAEERVDTVKYSKCVVYYDDERIYLTTCVFQKIIERNGIDAYRPEILLELEKVGAVKKGRNGFFEKRKIGENRHNVLSIPRALFNEMGLVDIIALAKEDIHNV